MDKSKNPLFYFIFVFKIIMIEKHIKHFIITCFVNYILTVINFKTVDLLTVEDGKSINTKKGLSYFYHHE